jgi:hypothetical protein
MSSICSEHDRTEQSTAQQSRGEENRRGHISDVLQISPQIQWIYAVPYEHEHEYLHLSPEAKWLIVVGGYVHTEPTRQSLDRS